MGFSNEWELCYSSNKQMSVWPWSDVVSLVNRHCKSLLAGVGQVLELGCGAGANIPFFKELNIDYYAVDGSPYIVELLHERFPELKQHIRVADFTVNLPFAESFDLILDRASVILNSSVAIQSVLNNALSLLKPGGLFIGVDWFSTNHTDYSIGDSIDDRYTKTNFLQGQFMSVGKVHFSDESHMRELFAKYEILFLEEKQSCRYKPQDFHLFASWNIVARKSIE